MRWPASSACICVGPPRLATCAPAQVAEQAGPADRQAEEVVQQIPGLAQGDAEVGAAVTGQQARPRADVGARQFQVAAALARPLTATAAVEVAVVSMPLDLRFGDVGHEMVLELAGRFEVAAAAMAALLGLDVLFDEVRIRRPVGSNNARMSPVLLAAAVRRGCALLFARAARALAALPDLLEFVLHLAQTASQVGVFRLQRGDAIQKLLPII